MKEKKHIDELFKDRFKNFEASPSPKVWENIAAQLRKDREDRKVVPLWIKLGGVAAVLALLFTIGNSVFNYSTLENPIITNEEIKIPVKGDSEILQKEKVKSTEITSEDLKIHLKESETNADAKSSKKDFSTEKNFNKTSDSKNAVAVEKETVTSLKTKEGAIKNENEVSEKITAKEALALQKEKESISEKEKSVIVQKNSTEIIAANKTKTDKIGNEIINLIVEENTEITKTEEPKKKTSIFDAIEEQNSEDAIVKNPEPENRWSVLPNVAPVYYSSLGNGSSLDPSFADNEQSGDVNMSYGVQVSYAISNRLSIRSGLSNVDLSYSTGGIDLGTGPVSVALRSVDYGNNEIVLTAFDKGELNMPPPGSGFGNIIPKSTQGNAQILQNINYYEVPLELKYALFSNKLGVNLIGGLSTLFLGNNEISVQADDFKSVLGEANNLSSVSFTTNVGLGLDYKISKRFLFNIEPMFKYQLNPYTDASNFKPYYIGVYTGFSFKF